MAKKKKAKHRFIRNVDGVLEKSPPGVDPDEWYQSKLNEKKFVRYGLISGQVPTFLKYSAAWFIKRKTKYPKSTWYSDEQRLRDYLLPHLGDMPMHMITRQKMRSVLEKVTQEGKSQETRTRVKALASKIFSDAMNEDPPLVQMNPVHGLKFDGARKGTKLPAILEDEDEILSYLRAAQECGWLYVISTALGLMAGMRKSEKLPRKWRNVKWKQGVILIDTHVEQASLSILPGTKAGSDEARPVQVPLKLLELLKMWREVTPFQGENDFILCDEKGDWIRPRRYNDMIDEVSEKFGRQVTDHVLRHSYGAHFAGKTGNLRALQKLLGHKSITTTQRYSELSGRQMAEFSEVASFEITPEIVEADTSATPKRGQK